MKKTLIIVGAGIVGVALSRLAKREGYTPVLIDPRGVAGGASAVPRALVQPVTGMRASIAPGALIGRETTERLVREVAPSTIHRTDVVRPALDDKHAELWSRRLAECDPEIATFVEASVARKLEPLLIESVRGAIHVPNALVIDSRAALESLARDIRLVRAEVTTVSSSAGRVEVGLRRGGFVYGDNVVIAAGPWSGQVWAPLADWMRPMFGELLVVHADLEPRCVVGHRGQLHALGDSRFLVGATYAPNYEGVGIRADSVRLLLERTAQAVPAMASATPLAAWSAYRAATRDRAPIIGPLDEDGRIWACCGHGSKGWLHGPWTAGLLLGWMGRGECPVALPVEWSSHRVVGGSVEKAMV